jgi:hypothetical protein
MLSLVANRTLRGQRGVCPDGLPDVLLQAASKGKRHARHRTARRSHRWRERQSGPAKDEKSKRLPLPARHRPCPSRAPPCCSASCHCTALRVPVPPPPAAILGPARCLLAWTWAAGGCMWPLVIALLGVCCFVLVHHHRRERERQWWPRQQQHQQQQQQEDRRQSSQDSRAMPTVTLRQPQTRSGGAGRPGRGTVQRGGNGGVAGSRGRCFARKAPVREERRPAPADALVCGRGACQPCVLEGRCRLLHSQAVPDMPVARVVPT